MQILKFIIFNKGNSSLRLLTKIPTYSRHTYINIQIWQIHKYITSQFKSHHKIAQVGTKTRS